MRIPKLIIPLLVVISILGGYTLRLAFTQPTTNVAYANSTGATSTFVVDGLKCKGTAAFFTSLYDSIPGINSIETFATEHKAIIGYNPDIITRDSIKTIMEQQVSFEDGTEMQVFKCLSVE